MKLLLKGTFALALAVLFSACVANENFQVSSDNKTGFSHGEVVVKEGKEQAWDSEDKKFITLEEFFRTYAKRSGGLTWGQSKNYPSYKDVNEFDLFMVEVGDEICLMEFYHDRWRRANDVRRWDIAFNEFSACSKVFN